MVPVRRRGKEDRQVLLPSGLGKRVVVWPMGKGWWSDQWGRDGGSTNREGVVKVTGYLDPVTL
jgi:hypothetical protein